jgi:hypothetical protein
MSVTNVEHFDFLEPRKKTDFPFYGTAAAKVFAAQKESVDPADYTEMVTELLRQLVLASDAPMDVAKAVKVELDAAYNKHLSTQTAKKNAGIKRQQFVRVDGDGDFPEDNDVPDDAPAKGAAVARKTADEEEEEVMDVMLEGEELRLHLLAEAEKAKKQEEEEKKAAAEREAKEKARLEEEKRNNALLDNARWEVDTSKLAGMAMLTRDDDEFGGFAGKGKGGKGGKRR